MAIIKEIKYPDDCKTTNDKMEFCYVAQETLRLAHNEMGEKFRDGNITAGEWEDYKNNDFKVKQLIITENLLQQKEAMKKSTRFVVDLEKL